MTFVSAARSIATAVTILSFGLSGAEPSRASVLPPAAPADDAALSTGWRWELEPVELQTGEGSLDFARFVESGYLSAVATAGDMVVCEHVRTSDLDLTGSKAPRYEIYLWTRDGERVPGAGWGSMGNGEMTVVRYRIPYEGEISELGRLGLAVLDFEGRTKAAKQGMARAAKLGASVAPLPVIGESYEFDLPTLDGDRIRSSDLRGKVVLIDFWATWCGPCMAKMPDVKELANKYGDDLVVIGIDMDEDVEKAKEVIESEELDWPHVNAKVAAAGHDELWEQVTGIRNIPRVLVIDRDGILRLDIYPHDLVEQLSPLMSGKGN